MYDFNIINADTDSILVGKQDGSPFTPGEQKKLIEELNSLFPEHINWDEDGYFDRVIVIKAKNYILKENGTGKIKYKGSATKTSSKEPALRSIMEEIIGAMLEDKNTDQLIEIYHKYIKEVLNVQDITRWAQKKTITESIVKCGDPKEKVRKNELDVWDAIKDGTDRQQGNKIYVYPVILGTSTTPGGTSNKTGKPLKDKVVEITGLKLSKNWTNDHNVEKLLERCFATVKIFSSVLDMNKFLDYSKAKNRKLLPLLDLGT